MAKLYFRYGAMGSAKSLNLLAVAYNYERQKKRVFLIKPAVDDRDGANVISSRAGLSKQADFQYGKDETNMLGVVAGYACILVDEAQFLLPGQVDQLRLISVNDDTPVICYGLRTDFRGDLFPGSKRLMEVADTIEEIKTTCEWCERKATQNMRMVDGQGTLQGPAVLIGGHESYISVCWEHWYAETHYKEEGET